MNSKTLICKYIGEFSIEFEYNLRQQISCPCGVHNEEQQTFHIFVTVSHIFKLVDKQGIDVSKGIQIIDRCGWEGRNIIVSDRKAGRCLEPEGNGVNPGGGNWGGPGPPSEEQDKQLITSRGGGNSLMEQQGRQEEESGMTKRTHRAQST